MALKRTPSRWWDALILAAIGACMTAWTWLTWPDILVDFGRELYVPWRLVAGADLYTDLAYFNGPLSPYFNALWFRVFGESVQTLVAVNLVVLALITWALYWTLSHAASRFSALAATAAFLAGLAFIRTNYNFVAPYSHELTHGILILLVGALAVYRFADLGGRGRWAFTVGLCAGLCALSKPEVFVASLALPVGLGVGMAVLGLPRSRVRSLAALATMGALVPLAVAYALLAWRIGAGAALSGLAAPWAMSLDRRVTSLEFYRAIMGLSPLWWNIAITSYQLAVLGFLAFIGVLFAHAHARLRPTESQNPRLIWRLTALAAGVGVSLVLFSMVPYLALSRAQPVVLLTLLVFMWRRLPGPGAGGRVCATSALVVTLILVAFLFAGKMVLATGVFHYGFALAMPGTMVMIVAVLEWAPREADSRGWTGSLFRLWAVGILVAVAALHLVDQSNRLEIKTYVLGTAPDRIRTDPVRGPAVGRALDVISANLRDGETFVVIPEGITLNFLLRTETPTPYLNFMPPEVLHFGEDNMLESLERLPPDLLILVQKDTREYGLGGFGEGYGRELLAWARDRYETIEVVGAAPLFGTDRFGIEVMRLRTR